jgi:hypothetical protein
MEKMFQGLITGADDVFIVDAKKFRWKTVQIFSKACDKELSLEKEITGPLLKGSLDMRRYHIKEATRLLIYPYNEVSLIEQNVLQKQYPLYWQYLKNCEGMVKTTWKYRMGRRSSVLAHLPQIVFLRPRCNTSQLKVCLHLLS